MPAARTPRRPAFAVFRAGAGMLAATLQLAACGSSEPRAPERRSESGGPSEARVPSEAELRGTWDVVRIDGAPPIERGPGQETAPYLLFDAVGYGGTVGCNHFGGLGLLDAGRYYSVPGPQTAMACGALTAQETAVTRILGGSPTLTAGADGTLGFEADGRTLRLRRSAAPRPGSARTAATPVLAGTSWNVVAIDGRAVPGNDRERGGRLDLEAGSWSAAIGCGRLSGTWRQAGDRIRPTGRAAPAPAVPCASPDERRALAGLDALMRAGPRVVQGPNGEMLIAGGGRWASAARRTGGLADEAQRLRGRWRIVAIDGRSPVEGRPAGLAFGPASYTGGTGCNAITGLFLAHERRLFTHPGPQTEQGCAGAVGAQEARINELLAASPRVALAGAGDLVLADARGGLRLRREAGAAPGPSAPPVRPLAAPVDAQLVSLDGEVLRMRLSDPESRLRVTPDGRWTAELKGVAASGVWRRRDGTIAFFTDPPPDRSAPFAVTAMRLFNGPARGVVDGNGELLIAGEAHWLAGRAR